MNYFSFTANSRNEVVTPPSLTPAVASVYSQAGITKPWPGECMCYEKETGQTPSRPALKVFFQPSLMLLDLGFVNFPKTFMVLW